MVIRWCPAIEFTYQTDRATCRLEIVFSRGTIKCYEISTRNCNNVISTLISYTRGPGWIPPVNCPIFIYAEFDFDITITVVIVSIEILIQRTVVSFWAPSRVIPLDPAEPPVV